MKEARGEFKVTDMAEETYAERDPGVLTRANGTQDFSGDIEGTGRVEWLMFYPGDGSADYVGIQEIDGTIQGRKGGFILTAEGRYAGGRSQGKWTVVPGSGSGGLASISGTGEFTAGPGPQATYRLSYELD